MMAAPRCLALIELVCANPALLAGFYEAAFGFVKTGTFSGSDDVELRLGDQIIRLIRAGPGGRTYPADVPGWSPLFQHIAIVASDMERAYAHLTKFVGWKPISTSGPQVLPIASGGVSAFKFRDPEGHPLELIAFRAGAVPPRWNVQSQDRCLGIDHSAISVSNTAASLAFYESLGLSPTVRSLNVGPEQARLDNVQNPAVEVTALTPPQATPHVELLCYRGKFDRHVPAWNIDDITSTRMVFTIDNRAVLESLCARMSGALLLGPYRDAKLWRAMLRDPDGHLILLEAAA
jgi:catechol 2,3-dioxygenase-like lactoylglutathione lyase family enzyme